MSRSIYLVSPRSYRPTYNAGEAYAYHGLPATTLIAELALPTVAALLPDDFEITLCDEQCMEVDFDVDVDYVGITGKVNQFARGREIADEFRRRGRTVIFGGSYATLSPGTVRPHCDILVRGELEELADELNADLRSGEWKDEYVGTTPDLTRNVRPRWELYPNERAVMGTVQTSRGCPFECEFCDVIVYLGRKQRHKPVADVLAELDATYRHGYRKVYLCDDNLTVYRRKAKELLEGIRDWNLARTDGHVGFTTQSSIDMARDPELLDLCAEAGLRTIFVGIETPNEDSLRDMKKRQNLVDLKHAIETIVGHGMALSTGAVIGFDTDGPDIFERHFEFFQALPVAQVTTATLVAPEGTPLWDRVVAEGRLIENEFEAIALPGESNIEPLGMTREERSRGLVWLMSTLYHPAHFEQRVLRFIELLGPRRDPGYVTGRARGTLRQVDADSMALASRIMDFGPEERAMMKNISRAARARPESVDFIGEFVILYLHARCMFDQVGLWDPSLVGKPVYA